MHRQRARLASGGIQRNRAISDPRLIEGLGSGDRGTASRETVGAKAGRQDTGFSLQKSGVVIEDPENPRNIGTVIRNVNALGAEKVYVVDPRRILPDDWDDLRKEPKLSKISVSAVKWTFVKRFDSTEECLAHLEKNRFVSVATSPHRKGKKNNSFTRVTLQSTPNSPFGLETRRRGSAILQSSVPAMCVDPYVWHDRELNLGTSSGIVLYEVAKQRRQYQSKYRLRDRRGERSVPLPTVLL